MLIIGDDEGKVNRLFVPHNHETGLVVFGTFPLSSVVFLKDVALIFNATERFSISAGDSF